MSDLHATKPRHRIVVVDDHPIVRTGIAALIDAEPDMEICGHAETMDEALEVIAREKPALVLVDLSLRESSGLDLLKEAVQRGVVCIVVSMHDSPTWAERSLMAGARGYVHKSEAGRNMVLAIRRVIAGDIYVSALVSDALVARRVAGDGGPDDLENRIATLTDRELEVFYRIGRGLTTKEIARELRLSPKTVQTYRERLKEKLALVSAAELSTEATRWTLEHTSPGTTR